MQHKIGNYYKWETIEKTFIYFSKELLIGENSTRKIIHRVCEISK